MCIFRHPMTPRIAAAFLLTFTVAGCGGTGSVSGEVKFNGVPLSGGWVTLNYTDGKQPVSGAIGTDGSYRISGCPTGDVRVTIRLTHGHGKMPSNPKRSAFPIRYADADKTDVKTTVTCGSQRLDLDLKP